MTVAPPPHQPTRPWYCVDPLVDDYLRIEREGGDLRMLKKLKILRAIVVNVGLVAISLYALSLDADPTIIGGVGLVSLAAYNGVEIADYGALLQAVAEASAETRDRSDE